MEGLRSASFFEVPLSLELDPEVYVRLPMPTMPGGHEPLFAAELNIGAETFYPQSCCDFLKFMLSETAQEQCFDLRHHWPIPVRQGTMIKLYPGEGGALGWRLLRQTHPIYEECPGLFRARFMLELAIESWLKNPTSVQKLCDHLNYHLQRFLEKSR